VKPGLVAVTILPLCRKKAGLDSYEKSTLCFGEAESDVDGNWAVIRADFHTLP
jgi:hypothetical protein